MHRQGARCLDRDPFILRPLRDDELPALLDLYRHLHFDDPALEVTRETQAIWRELRSNPTLRLLGADWQDRLVASCLLAVVPNLTRAGRPYGLIENVVTHADFRGRGIATALLRRALGEAWNLGCYKVMQMTGRKDEATLRFYRRAGFLGGAKTAFIASPPSAEISNPSPESP